MLNAPPDRVTHELIRRITTVVGASRILSAAGPAIHEPGSPPFGTLDDLEDACEESPRTRRGYSAFCKARSLDPNSDIAAGLFLEHLYGVPVLTVHLGNDPASLEAAFTELRSLSRTLGLPLHDPQSGNNIAETYTGALPPNF